MHTSTNHIFNAHTDPADAEVHLLYVWSSCKGDEGGRRNK